MIISVAFSPYIDEMGYYDALADLEYDEAVEEARQERAEKVLNQETRQVMRLKKRLKAAHQRKSYY